MSTRKPCQLDDILAGFKRRFDTIEGLRGTTAEPDHPNFPSAFPRLLEGAATDFDGDYEYLFEVWVITSLDGGLNRAQNELAPFLSTVGRKSMQSALEADPTLSGTVASTWVQAVSTPSRLDMAGLTVYGGNLRVRVYA